MVDAIKRLIVNMVKNTRTKTLLYAHITMVIDSIRVPK